jgi:hypothetical protein
MVVLFAVVALAVSACALILIGVGAGLLVEGEFGAAAFLSACGAFVSYGGYLFARAAIRTRRHLRAHPLSEPQLRARRANVKHVLAYTAAVIVGYLVLPAPTGVRVVAVIGAVLVVPLILVVDVEPPKERSRESRHP